MATNGDMLRAVQDRWNSLLKDEEFHANYKRLLNDKTFQVVTNMMREALYRPAMPEAFLTGDNAIFAQGFSTGAWAVYDLMRGLSPMAEIKAEVEPDYGMKDNEEEGKPNENQ